MMLRNSTGFRAPALTMSFYGLRLMDLQFRSLMSQCFLLLPSAAESRVGRCAQACGSCRNLPEQAVSCLDLIPRPLIGVPPVLTGHPALAATAQGKGRPARWSVPSPACMQA